MSFMASRGDIYLDESVHLAMCLQNDVSTDILGEFSIAETGDIDEASIGGGWYEKNMKDDKLIGLTV